LLATSILVEGHLQRDFLIKNGVILSSASKVFGEGPIGGIDLERFKEALSL